MMIPAIHGLTLTPMFGYYELPGAFTICRTEDRIEAKKQEIREAASETTTAPATDRVCPVQSNLPRD